MRTTSLDFLVVLKLIRHPYSRLRLVRVFKGENELVVEQQGGELGTKAKDAGLEVDETDMLE